jgi:transcriptional regulator with XRE-family HTH domain
MKKPHTLTQLNINLKKFRLAKGISQQKLSDHLGFKRSTYGQWETANIQPSIGQIIQIAEFFDTDVVVLYSKNIEVIHYGESFGESYIKLKTENNAE